MYYMVMNFGNIAGIFVNMLICGLERYKTRSMWSFDVIGMAHIPELRDF